MAELRFTSNVTMLEGQQGKLPKYKDGSFRCLVGAYNLENSAGEFYGFTERVKSLFTDSTMVRWLKNETLISEWNHPAMHPFAIPGRSKEQVHALWMARLATLDNSNQAAVITRVEWEPLPEKVDGKTVYGVFAGIDPTGEIHRSNLENPKHNTFHSLRSALTRSFSPSMGKYLLENVDLYTYDVVGNGGIHIACKKKHPGLEEESVIVTKDIYRNLQEIKEEGLLSNAGLESAVNNITTVIKHNGKWLEVEDVGNRVLRSWS